MTSPPRESYRKVQYDIRPAKQVERRMLLDSFQLLASDGFPIRAYQYTGMGSIFFYDYVMFHKLLGIERMVSAEFDKKIEKRVRFNAPFDGIDVRIAPIGDVIPSLSRDLQHILWLDYDDVIREGHLLDVMDAAGHLSKGSVLLVTLDAEPPEGRGSKPKDTLNHYQREAEQFLDSKPRTADFSRVGIPTQIGRIVQRAISRALVSRPNVRFAPLFNFMYADGHQMVTVGGMFVTDVEQSRLDSGHFARAPYLRRNWDNGPLNIQLPTITRKERMHLDSKMPHKGGWRPKEFELSQSDLDAYAQIYRFLPAYGELLV